LLPLIRVLAAVTSLLIDNLLFC